MDDREDLRAAMIADIRVLQNQHRQLERSLEEKHLQNRKDIHAVRDSMQTHTDRLTLRLEELADIIHAMQMSYAKQRGYYLGFGGALVILLDIGKMVLDHIWK